MTLSAATLRAIGKFVLTSLLTGPIAAAQGTGYWHTSGNQILDANNQQVRIAGINWYGFETTDAVVHGLNAADYKAILQTIKTQGYNTVRIPLSNQMVETPSSNLNIAYSHGFSAINTDLQGLNSLQVLDKIVDYAGTIGLKIILDNHRSEAGNSAEGNGLWYTGAYPEQAWINDWTALANRYLGNPTVIGFDLRNEPHNAFSGGACWDCGGANDWHLAAQRAGNAVQAVNPSLLLFVEGTDAYTSSDFYWWGGNLEGVAHSPVTLAVPNQLVYSAHDYGPTEYGQSWFNGSTSAASLSAVWTRHWAYISQQKIAPVWLGEFGSTNSDSDIQNSNAGSEGQWFQSLIAFLHADPTLNWTYWALNGEDNYGLLDSNYDPTPVSALKQSSLATNQFALSIAPATPNPPAAPSGLTATATSSSQINLSWTASPTLGVTYTVYFGGSPSVPFTVLASNLATTTYPPSSLNPSTTYYFNVVAISAAGTSAASNQASATTQAAPVTAPPSALTATAISSSQINLAWTPSPTSGVAYTIYSGATPGSVTTQMASGITNTTYPATNLHASTAYYFTIVATASGVSSQPSNAASATTSAATIPAPSAPSGLTASPSSASQINLQWQPSSTSGVSYSIFSGTVSGATTTLAASGLTGTNYPVTGLSDGTTYYFTVKAISGNLSSAVSNQASATTQVAPPVPPANVQASALSSTQINLSWSAVANTGATYSVYMGTSSGAENTFVAGSVNGTTYQVTGLNLATTYYFIVRSVSAGGTSAPSTQASASTQSGSAPVTPPSSPTAPSAPSALSATAVSTSQINLTWAPSSTSGVTYNVYAGASTLIASGLTSTSYSAANLTSSTTYYFTVTAVSSAGTSPASNQASATTQTAAPTAPTALSATASSSSQINLSWTASAGTGITYSLYTGSSSGAETTLLASGITSTSYSAANLTASTAYFYVVKAVSAGGASPASSEASATTQAATPGGCHVTYTDQTDWGQGFTGTIAITYSGASALNSWTLTYTYSGTQQIYQSWNSNFTQSGQKVTLTSAAWNGSITPGGTVSGIGFNANYAGANLNPTAFSLNGVACQ